ncbi:16 kda calcium-binding protein [Stylonychia lemnae]|uniref:16 kDa calcium-binding protein n=1 Tax=Stylonychia lemnae TaxID=5949 RepID=A0A078AKQ4_STYLE|nr:16 kda calcium-binding protein [Stylonychia lemnae]|eukprot:CDW82950.1 16 kda calcium-binding protein [Stylonychia lemnae]
MSGELGEVEIKLNELVEEVFKTYPNQTDENGDILLTKEDIKDFIRQTMEKANEGDAWDDTEFEACYREFDYDGNGTISKQELTQFIKRFAAL